jgi:hypothetical protein
MAKSPGKGGSTWVWVVLLAAALGLSLWKGRAAIAGSPTTNCPTSLSAQNKLTKTQAVSQDELNVLAKQFVDYCAATPGIKDDPRVLALTATWNKLILLSDFPDEKANTLGTFNKFTGCLLLRDLKNVKSLSEQLGIMLHELAHSNGWNHDDTWRDCFLYFINLATQKLGWEVSLKCPTSCKNYQVCEKSQCEYCDWINFENCAKK